LPGSHTSYSLSTFRTYADNTAEQEPSLWLPWPVNTVVVSKSLHDELQNPVGMIFPEYWTCSARDCWCSFAGKWSSRRHSFQRHDHAGHRAAG
jgi:hypothetical protein